MSYEVVAVRYATREGSRGDAFYRYGSYGEPDGPLAMDYFFWLLRAPDGRTIVVDSGFEPELGARMGRTVLVEPAEALARLGVDPAAVELVVLTHLHYDHIGNLRLFPNAELVVAERDLEFWSGPLAGRPQFAHHVDAEDVAWVRQAQRDGRVRLVADELEVAPGIRALRVGGHSPGQLVLVVETPGRDVVLASDALHYYEELEHDRPFSVFTDLVEMYEAYDLLRDLAGARDRVLVAGHDPLVSQRFPPLNHDAGFALRIAPDGGS